MTIAVVGIGLSTVYCDNLEGEGGDACERYEQKAARRHRRGLYVSPHHPSVICANCIFQHCMRLFNIRMAVFTPYLHIQ